MRIGELPMLIREWRLEKQLPIVDCCFVVCAIVSVYGQVWMFALQKKVAQTWKRFFLCLVAQIQRHSKCG